MAENPEQAIEAVAAAIGSFRLGEERRLLRDATSRSEAEATLVRMLDGNRRAFLALRIGAGTNRDLRRAINWEASFDAWFQRNAQHLSVAVSATLRDQLLPALVRCTSNHHLFWSLYPEAPTRPSDIAWEACEQSWNAAWQGGGFADQIIEQLRTRDLPRTEVRTSSDDELRRLLRLVSSHVRDQQAVGPRWTERARRHYSDELDFVRRALGEMRKLRLEESESALFDGLRDLEAATAARIAASDDEEQQRRDKGERAGRA